MDSSSPDVASARRMRWLVAQAPRLELQAVSGAPWDLREVTCRVGYIRDQARAIRLRGVLSAQDWRRLVLERPFNLSLVDAARLRRPAGALTVEATLGRTSLLPLVLLSESPGELSCAVLDASVESELRSERSWFLLWAASGEGVQAGVRTGWDDWEGPPVGTR